MDQKLQELQQQLEGMRKFDSYQNKGTSIEKEINHLEGQVEQLERSLKKEERDVTKIEKGGLQAFCLKVVGKYEETKEKEILEAAQAKVKLENKRFELEDAKKAYHGILIEKRKYIGCEEQYRMLYEERMEQLLSEESNIKVQLLELKTKRSNSEHMSKEIKEAIEAGIRVQTELSAAEEKLESARSYGTWDIIGGGTLTDLIKHSELDAAKERVNNVQRLMRAFRTELADVNMTLEIQIDTDGFAKFADFFFDGFFADISMQHRVEEAIDSVTTSKSKVQHALDRLNALHVQENEAIETIQSQIDEIVNGMK